MVLTPEEPDLDVTVYEELPLAPSKTYKLNLETGDIEDVFIDGVEAVRQFIQKAVMTERYRYLIYDDDYGSEIHTLIGQNFTPELVNHELERVITEAIIYDERILEVKDFNIEREGNTASVTFNVVLDDSVVISEGVVLNVL